VTPRGYLNLAGALVILGLLGFIWWAWGDYQALKAYKDNADSTANVTSETTGALSQATTETQRVEVVVTQQRSQRDQAFEELKRNDQTVNDWASQPIPQQLRDIDSSALDRPENSTGRSGVTNPKD
jgi:hypothetical protein